MFGMMLLRWCSSAVLLLLHGGKGGFCGIELGRYGWIDQDIMHLGKSGL